MKNDSSFKIETITDIPVTISVEVGKKTIKIKDLQEISQGSVVELDKPVGDLLDIKVNGKIIAKGEIVVVNNKFGGPSPS